MLTSLFCCNFVPCTNIPQNIEKAKKEIERLEAEESGAVSGTATPNGTNGKKTAAPATEDQDVAEVTEGVKEVAVEDKKEEEVKA